MKIEVHIWDEVGGEWGKAYPDADPENNREVHEKTADFIDLSLEEDVLLYRVNVEGLGINIGYFGGRDHLYIELWGDRAEAVINLAKAEKDWFPRSPRQALISIDRLHSAVKFAVGD